jgi:hypothetical protein
MNSPEHIGTSMGASSVLIENFNVKPESSQCPVGRWHIREIIKKEG